MTTFAAIYGSILRLLPEDFRRRYGQETLDVACRRVAARRGPGRIATAIRELMDLAATVRRERRAGRLASASTGLGRETGGVRTVLSPDGLWGDLRQALRRLLGVPMHSASIVSLLAIAIGANVAIFSLVNALILRELPVDHPEQLVALKRMSRGVSQGMSIPLFEDLRTGVTSADLTAIADLNAQLIINPADGPLEPDPAGAMVSGNYFQVLRARAAIGRLFGEDDDRFSDPAPVLVLSHDLWRTRFSGDPTVVGRSVLLSGNRFTIVGVASRELRALGGDRGLGGEYWIPLNTQPVVSGGTDRRRNPGASMLRVMGRLRDGFSVEQAHAEADLVYRRLPPQIARPESAVQASAGNRGFGDALARRYWPPLRMLLAGVSLLMVMACANVASLLVARTGTRQHEFAVRQALGSGRARLVRQLLMESLLLAAAAAILGLAWAAAGAHALIATAVPEGTPALDLSLDRNILAFTVALAVVATLVLGLLPALQVAPRRIESALRGASRGTTGRSRHRLNRVLVAFQVALAVVLVVGAAHFARSLYRLYAADLGFDRRNMIIAAVDGRPAGYQTAEQFALLAREIVERLSALPGVESTTVAATGFFGGGRRSTRTYTVGRRAYGGPDDPALYFNEVSNDYLRAFAVPFVAGRDFTQEDRAGAPRVGVVNEAFVRRYLSGQNPIGRQVQLDDDASRAFAIIGVVGDSKLNDIREDAEPLAYLPFEQFPARFSHVFLEVADSDRDVQPLVRPALAAVHPRLRVDRVQTLEAALDGTLSQDILAARLSGVFGVAAVTLVGVGVYGVISFLVITRTREIGVRLAIGARPGTVLRQMIGDAFWTVLPGLVAGTAIAAALEGLIAAQLFESSPRDPVIFGSVVLLLALLTIAAAYVPARRAASIAPVIALRND